MSDHFGTLCIKGLNDLETATQSLLKWFETNKMKANPYKYHLLVNNVKINCQITVGNDTITTNKYEKLLGIKTECN